MELGLVNTYFATRVAYEKASGKARSAGHSEPMVKLYMVKLPDAASTFFRAQPEGTGRILSSPSLLVAYRGLLCGAACASFRIKSVTVAGVK